MLQLSQMPNRACPDKLFNPSCVHGLLWSINNLCAWFWSTVYLMIIVAQFLHGVKVHDMNVHIHK